MNWHVIRCEPKREQIASDNLDHWGCEETYIPRYRIAVSRASALSHKQRKSGLKVTTSRLLCPGYIFARLAGLKRDLHSIMGVRGLLVFGNDVAKVNDEIIDKMRHIENGPPFSSEYVLNVRVGDKVRINAGSFTGVAAVVEKILDPALDGSIKVSVLTDLFGRKTRTVLGVEEVERI